jgi:hypothetical protein
MINAGPRRTFQASIASWLRQLSTDRFDRQPVPIELFIVGDRDARRESTVSTPDASRVDPDDAISSDTTADDTHGAKLDAFFREEERFHPNYRRVFRSSAGGSVIIDLLTPVRR